jgi:glucose/mannose transport system substrate-binding protein
MGRGGEYDSHERPRCSCQGHAAPLVLVLLPLIGCRADSSAVQLEVYSWWRQSSERNAFDDVIRIDETRHSGVNVVNRADPTAPDARSVMAERLLAGAPPSTFQANIGADLLRWTVVDTASDQVPATSLLGGLGDFFQRLQLTSAIPSALFDALRVGNSEPYAVPINIHRLNMLYYNTDLLAAFQARHPDRSLLDLASLCPADPQAAALDATIAVGAQDGFALVLLAFESVLPALAGADFYDALFRGQAPSDWVTEVQKVLSCVQYLSRSFVAENANLDWAQAADFVANGQAAATVMGDWANGQLKAALDDGRVAAIPFPGSEAVFVFTSDTFPLPVQGPHRTETEDLLSTIVSADAQYAFSAEKGSIPALDLDPTPLGERARQTKLAFASVRKVLATSGLFPSYYPVDELGQALFNMTRPHAGQAEIDAVVTLVANSEPLLSRWQNRLGQGPAPPANLP